MLIQLTAQHFLAVLTAKSVSDSKEIEKMWVEGSEVFRTTSLEEVLP